MFSSINTIVGAVLGAALIGVVAWLYNGLIDNPSIVRETTVQVEAKARERTLQAINEVTDAAQKARAMRRFCRDDNWLYDFATGKCR
jgi:hypothetical protein